jgi:hypothetical protein
MFVATSTIQNSVWGWASKPLPTTGKGSFTTGLSRYSNYTLGPDGWVYALPSSSVDQALLVIDPGSANSNKSNYSAAAGQFVIADGSTTRPTFIARDATAGATFESKGIVAPNGKIYFFTKTHRILCELTPAGLSSTWKFHDLSTSVVMNSAGGSYAGYNYFLGVILGKDGYLYLIPNGRVGSLSRINISGATPVVEHSYYDGSTGKIFHIAIKSPLGKVYTAAPSTDCFTATAPTTAGSSHWDSTDNPSNALLSRSQSSNSMSAGLACLDPVASSHKIYFTIHLGTWIMWIDPDNWGNANVVGTVENLWLRKLVSGYGGYRSANTVLGCLNSSYKFGSMTPGANRKLYINITNIAFNGTASSTIYDTPANQLAQHTIEVDTVNNIATLVPSVTGERIQGYYGGSDMLPNGYVLVLPNLLAADPAVQSTYGSYHRKVLQIDTNYGTAKVKPEAYTTNTVNPGWENISIHNPNGFLATPVVTNNDNQVQHNNIVVLPGSKRGKMIIAGRNNTFGVELMSVKGFYKGVTHFDLKNTYDPTNGVNKIEMPSVIANIATSDYNVYYNKIT